MVLNFSGIVDEVILLRRQLLPTQVLIKLDWSQLLSLYETNLGTGLVRIMVLESLISLAVDLLRPVDVLHLVKSRLIVALLNCNSASMRISAQSTI